jgi:protein TonB
MRYLIAVIALLASLSSAQAQEGSVALSNVKPVADSIEEEFIAKEIRPLAIDTISNFIEYPEMAKRAGIEGDVTLQALIAKDGTVLRVKILKSSNFIFEKPAFDAMHKVRYKPATSSGKPVQLWVTERVIFKLH